MGKLYVQLAVLFHVATLLVSEALTYITLSDNNLYLGILGWFLKNTMLYHRLHPTQNKNTYLHDMFRFLFKSFSGASHNK
jgi:hypothetical protein